MAAVQVEFIFYRASLVDFKGVESGVDWNSSRMKIECASSCSL
jgi:hypothetical protein